MKSGNGAHACHGQHKPFTKNVTRNKSALLEKNLLYKLKENTHTFTARI